MTGKKAAVDANIIKVRITASIGKVIFFFLNLNGNLFEISLNPNIKKYETGGAIKTKYLSVLIINMLLNMKNTIYQAKTRIYMSINLILKYFVIS